MGPGRQRPVSWPNNGVGTIVKARGRPVSTWIALAIVIFGGWSPIRGALGALLFGASKALAAVLQRRFPEVSLVAFNTLPWLLMIAVLVLVGSDITDRLIVIMPRRFRQQFRQALRVRPPAALGQPFIPGESGED